MTHPESSPGGLSELSELMIEEQDASLSREARKADPKARRARRRGLIAAATVIAVVLALVGGYVVWALNAPLPAVATEWSEPKVALPAGATVRHPAAGSSAISISGADDYLGPAASGIWATSGTDEPRPIASITKLITALVILDAKPLAGVDDPGPRITFSKADHDLYDKYYVMGATIAAMPTGSSMSQYDALATMLIPSASNYAEAVSSWAFGSQGAFRAATKRWLEANGLVGTTVVEPTGMNPRNTSTPTDLLAIGKLAAANPVIARIVSTTGMTLPGPGGMANTNGLLGQSGITGLKTGNLGENTFNLLYTASIQVGAGVQLDITGVMLGGGSRQSVNSAVLGLLESIRTSFHEVPVATTGQVVGTYSTPWGASAQAVVSKDVSIFTWSDTPIAVTMETDAPAAYTDGSTVGTITWTAGPKTKSAPLTLQGSIEPPSAWWRLTHPAELIN